MIDNPPSVYLGRARSKASDDDDDFDNFPSDSEVETRSLKSSSSRSSGASRRFGGASSDDEDGFERDEDEEPKKKGKSSGKSASSKGNSKTLASSGASATFLTAAEQREQGKKEEKKAAESPYSFLADNIRDVSKKKFVEFFLHTKCPSNQKEGRKPDSPDYDPGTLYIPSKVWSTFTPFEKQVCFFFFSCGHMLTLS